MLDIGLIDTSSLLSDVSIMHRFCPRRCRSVQLVIVPSLGELSHVSTNLFAIVGDFLRYYSQVQTHAACYTTRISLILAIAALQPMCLPLSSQRRMLLANRQKSRERILRQGEIPELKARVTPGAHPLSALSLFKPQVVVEAMLGEQGRLL